MGDKGHCVAKEVLRGGGAGRSDYGHHLEDLLAGKGRGRRRGCRADVPAKAMWHGPTRRCKGRGPRRRADGTTCKESVGGDRLTVALARDAVWTTPLPTKGWPLATPTRPGPVRAPQRSPRMKLNLTLQWAHVPGPGDVERSTTVWAGAPRRNSHLPCATGAERGPTRAPRQPSSFRLSAASPEGRADADEAAQAG